MSSIIKYEQEQLWDTVKLLYSIDKNKAKILLKITIEKSLQLMNLPTSFISKIDFSIPDEAYLLQLKDLDSHIQEQLSKPAPERVYEDVVEYINMISHISDDPVYTSKKILASMLAEQGKNFYIKEQSLKSIYSVEKDEKRYYTPNEAAKKLGLSDQTIRRMCEKEKFQGAYKTEGGHWRIPENIFVTTRGEDKSAEDVIKHIDRKNSKAGEVDEFDL